MKNKLGSPPHLHIGNQIATITLSRPESKSRLHNEDLVLLLRYFDEINLDKSIRVVVLTAEVSTDRPIFSAGYNIDDFSGLSPKVAFEDVVDALEQLRPVTICALNGSVFGGATDFALACDFAICIENIELRMPAAAIGLHYYGSGLRRYVTRLGINEAKKIFLTAVSLDSAELLRIGYVSRVVPKENLESEVFSLAKKITALAPLAVEALKMSLNEIALGNYDADILDKRHHFSLESQDFIEGRRAFKERRVPMWKGY